MSSVIGLADFIRNGVRHRDRGAFPVGAARHSATGFTLRDHEDLRDWAGHDRRVSLCTSDPGNFAMLYEPGRLCASWGVVRQGRSVLLWDCVTLADIGEFPTMIDALSAVAVEDFTPPAMNVIEFTSARARMAPRLAKDAS